MAETKLQPKQALKNTVICRVYRNGNQDNLTQNAVTKVLLNAESFDPGNHFDTTNSRFTAPVTGYYQVNWAVHWKDSVSAEAQYTYIYVNGSARITFGPDTAHITYGNQHFGSGVVYAESGQYIEMYVMHDGAANTVDLFGGATWIDIYLITPA